MPWPVSVVAPRQRVVSDNDYGGDPDGLLQLAHLLLSPSVEVRTVIASRLRAGDPFGPTGSSTARGAAAATRIASLCGRADVAVIAGSESGVTSRTEPAESPAARAIVAEAMRTDTDLPLFVTCGGGLTEMASAWLIEPRIADRLTLVWIGGPEYPDLADPPPGAGPMEYNLAIDPTAAQVVFNDSNLSIWQVPRATYRMAMASRAELLTWMGTAGPLGRHLLDALGSVAAMAAEHGVHVGEVYVLGDSPLVLLTALWTGFEPGPASSPSVTRPCPRIGDDGRYVDRPDGRPIRVFTALDTRLMFGDLAAKLALLAADGRNVNEQP